MNEKLTLFDWVYELTFFFLFKRFTWWVKHFCVRFQSKTFFCATLTISYSLFNEIIELIGIHIVCTNLPGLDKNVYIHIQFVHIIINGYSIKPIGAQKCTTWTTDKASTFTHRKLNTYWRIYGQDWKFSHTDFEKQNNLTHEVRTLSVICKLAQHLQ